MSLEVTLSCTSTRFAVLSDGPRRLNLHCNGLNRTNTSPTEQVSLTSRESSAIKSTYLPSTYTAQSPSSHPTSSARSPLAKRVLCGTTTPGLSNPHLSDSSFQSPSCVHVDRSTPNLFPCYMALIHSALAPLAVSLHVSHTGFSCAM
jgi:hypothetical protein